MHDGDYLEGEKHGDWVTYYANGNKRSEGHYNQGKKDGLWVQYWPNGNKKSECLFVGDFPPVFTPLIMQTAIESVRGGTMI